METKIDWTDEKYALHKESFDKAVEQCYWDLKSKESSLTDEQLKEFAYNLIQSLYYLILQDLYVPIV